MTHTANIIQSVFPKVKHSTACTFNRLFRLIQFFKHVEESKGALWHNWKHFRSRQKIPKKERKPFSDENRSKKNTLALSPLNETPQSEEEGLVSILAEALLPALNKIMKPHVNQKELSKVNAEPDPNMPIYGEATGLIRFS